jgi:heat shock protein HtpX
MLQHLGSIDHSSLPRRSLVLPVIGWQTWSRADVRSALSCTGITGTQGPHHVSNTIKTWTLMAALGGILMAVGGLIGGQSGIVMAFLFALALNGFVYWKSDSLALRANGARELGPDEQPRLRSIIALLADRAAIPMPRVYIVERPEPNAFATGRDPKHSAIAVTTGLLHLMDERQLIGVLAHELSHVKNRDTLIGTIAATFGGAISFLAQMGQFQLIFGGGDDDNGNPMLALVAIILAPIAALVIQLAVSRGREYQADSTGATLTGDPEGLAQALETLQVAQRQQAGLLTRMRGGVGRRQTRPLPQANPAFGHLWIVNPLAGSDVAKLFSTHPPLEERITRLRAMRLRRAA